MSSSFSTAPADAPRPWTVGRAAITWTLFGIWVFLMLFAVVSLINPPWLQELSRPGRDVEARDAKDHGDNFMRNQDVQMAIAQYLEALRIQPEMSSAMVNLGIAYNRLGQTARAEQWLLKAMTVPDAPQGMPHFHLADLCLKRGEYDEGIRHCQLAIENGVDPSAAWHREAEIYVAAKRWPQAAEAYENVLRYERDPVKPYREMLYAELPFSQADSLVRALDPATLDRYDGALIKALIKNDQEISRMCNDLGVINLYMGDTLRATEHIREAVAIWPGNQQARNNLAQLVGRK